jgi:16S rRNA (adenine(1408)-N(1))-methyltransferase
VDLGTGDGRFALATAAANPERLVLGIDPVASAMAEASRRAAQPAPRGGVRNAAFVVASAEALPAELAGTVERLTVNLPWGSLLRGALALPDAEAAARGIAGLLAPDGEARLLLAPAARDGLADDVDVEARLEGSLADDWRALGLELVQARRATAADLAAARTRWGRRLGLGSGRSGAGPRSRGASSGREAWLLELRATSCMARPPRGPSGDRDR